MQTLLEMLDSAPSSIMVVGEGSVIHYANRKTLELHGYTRDEFLRLRVQDLDTPASAARFEGRMREFTERGELAFEVEHYRKDRTVLPLEAVAHRVTWEGRPAILSIANDLTEKRALQVEAMRRTRDLSLFHLFVVGLATVAEDELHRHIAHSLKELTGAYFVTISDFDPLTRCLAHRHLEIDPGMAGRFIQFLGSRVEDIPTPLSDEVYQLVTRKGWSLETSLYDAAFGSLPLPVAAGLQKWLHLDRFIGISFLSGDRLYGTSLLALQRDQPDPSMDMLQAYRQVASIALGARAAVADYRKVAAELERARPMEVRGRLAASVAPDLEQLAERIRRRTQEALDGLPEGDLQRVSLGDALASASELKKILKQLKEL